MQHEELLILSPKGYLLSLTNPNYMNMLNRVNLEESELVYKVNRQSIKFTFSDNQGDHNFLEYTMIHLILMVAGGVIRRQKNGWEGQRRYPGKNKDAGTLLYYQERRPGKSKEFATSINTTH